MRSAFADTSFYQALLNPRDRWHKAAVKLSNAYHGHVITSEYVLCELGALMSHGRLRQVFLDLVHALSTAAHVKIIPASHDLFEAGIELFGSRPDKEWSLTDCVSFTLMNRHGIGEALASDRDFEQAGFSLLLDEK